MNKIVTEHISMSYGGVKTIQDISITLKEGELVSLLGTSGAGKTTLFNIVSGLMCPDRGKVFLDGKDITGQPGHIAYMLQKDLLLPYQTVLNNVALPLLIKGIGKKEALFEAQRHFKDFGLEGTEEKYPHQLSGGMRQRAALLRTYMFSHNVALLDEPFSALDTITKRSMHHWYLDVMSKINLSTLFITHDIDEAILLSDRIYIMTGQPGQIVHEIFVNIPKPRNNNTELEKSFLYHKKEILAVLGIN